MSNILKEVVINTKYARFLPYLERREDFSEIIERNKAMHIDHLKKMGVPESDMLFQKLDDVYELVNDSYILPSMRSLQFAGHPIEKHNERMYNCAYLYPASSVDFAEMMFLGLCGCGIGFSVEQQYVKKLPPRQRFREYKYFDIEDSIEGWSDAVKALVSGYLETGTIPLFSYGSIRKKGQPIRTGGVSPGPDALRNAIRKITELLKRKKVGERLTSIEVYDIVCYIGDCIVSGGIRRIALICFFSEGDMDMMKCKDAGNILGNYQRYRSNNSMVVYRNELTEEKFKNLFKHTRDSNTGEPGIFIAKSQNQRSNPCVEAGLMPYSFCNLVEANGAKIKDQETLEKVSRAMAFLGTIQATYTDFSYLSERWKKATQEDSLLGCSITGICEMDYTGLDLKKAAEIMKQENIDIVQYLRNQNYCSTITPAARIGLVKPAGSTSCIFQTSSGIHPFYSKFYIRRVQVLKDSAAYNAVIKQCPELVEDDVHKPDIQAIISIPCIAPAGSITRNDETPVDMVDRIVYFMKNWVLASHNRGEDTHNISATLHYKPEEFDTLLEKMWKEVDFLTGVTIFPYDSGVYQQAPFEEISDKEYKRMLKYAKNISIHSEAESNISNDFESDIGCTGPNCEVRFN